jgi:hypothetical protein
MPVKPPLLNAVTGQPPAEAWSSVVTHLRDEFFAPVAESGAESEIVRRDRGLAELDNVLSGSAWDLWAHFEKAVPAASKGIVEFWTATTGGKAVLILDGLSLREAPWLLEQAKVRGYKLLRSEVRGSELPGETTPFAKSLGFGQRSALENNGGGSAHKLTGAFTACCNLPWKDCVEMVGSQQAVVFWHHWPDERMHDLSGPGLGLRKLAKEAHAALTSDDFWAFVDRLTTGRKLVITGDHGYAACGEFPDLTGDQAKAIQETFGGQRFAPGQGDDIAIPPLTLSLPSAHGPHRYVLGRRKWKTQGGHKLLQHGGLSLLELLVPFLEISK